MLFPADLAAVRGVLAGTALEDAGLAELPVPRSDDEVAIEVELGDRDPLSVWRSLRGMTAATGRWPVLVEVTGEEVFDRQPERECEGAPQEIIDAALALPWPDPSGAPVPWEVDDEQWWGHVVNSELGYTRRRHGHAPSPAEVLAGLPDRDHVALDAALLAWEEQHEPAATPETPMVGGPSWGVSDAVAVLLLPDPSPWSVPAYIEFYGASGVGWTARLVRALASWNQRFGAEPCAATLVTVDLWIREPPTDPWDARDAVVEQLEFVKMDDEIRGHARSLVGNPWWLLYDHP